MRNQIAKIIIYILLLAAVMFFYRPLMKLDDHYIYAADGEADLTGFDFTRYRARVYASGWEYYPERLYTPGDFQAGAIDTPIYENNINSAAYGSYRVTLNLPPGKTYGITGRSFLYSTKIYINGALADEIGAPGSAPETTTPRTNTYAVYFTPQTDITEIIFQVANFQMEDGGGSYSFSLGEAGLVERYRLTRLTGAIVVVGSLITVALLFIGIFIFFTNRRCFLYYALMTLTIAVRIMFTGDKPVMEFFPDFDWYAGMRIEYLTFVLIFVFALLYFHALYKKLIWRPVFAAALGLSALYGGVVLFFEPMVFGALNIYFYALCGAAGLYVLIKLAIGLKNGDIEHILVFTGILLFFLAAVNDMIQYSLPVFMRFYDIISVGMLFFVHINMIALTIGFERTEKEYNEAKQREEELTRKTNFYHRVSHDLLTPLTRVSTCVQSAGRYPEDAPELLAKAQADIMEMAEMINDALRRDREGEA